MHAVRDRLMGTAPWGGPDALTRLKRDLTGSGQRAEADFRRYAIWRSTPWGLRRLLKRVPDDAQYFNVGHSNLSLRVLSGMQKSSIKINVLIHDVIPLEYPRYQRPGTVAPFRAKIERVRSYADRIIYNSADTMRRTEALMSLQGPVPPGIFAHLGTMHPVPDASEIPHGLPPQTPYFITVGTIEPRKNHAFLLDIWERLGPDAPPLLICGSRGWNNDAVFARLDALPEDGPVRELPGLSDPALAALVSGAAGALFPSHAEGFGLPPLEAVLLGTRVLCNDLDVLREFLGYIPVYASVSDQYLWEDTIRNWCADLSDANLTADFEAPTWDAHFNTVLSALP